MSSITRRDGPLLSHMGRCLSIDTRTLAVFRMIGGVLILADLIARGRHFTRFYTEDGVVPQSLALDHVADGAFSFYFLTTDTNLTMVLWAIQALLAVLMIVGYRTWLATFFSFLFVVSLDHRNTLVLSHADTLFRLLMFWAVLLPLGARWSIDARQGRRPPPLRVASIASAAILVQMVYMYAVNGYHKSTSDAWLSGDATVLIFGLDDTTHFIGDTLRAVPLLLRMGGYLWFFSLVLSPLLLFLPGRARYPLLMLLIGGHASFALTVRIGAFPYVGIMGAILFLQAEFWEDLQRLAERLNFAGRIEAARLRVQRLGDGAARRLPAFQPTERVPELARTYVSDVAAIIAVIAVLIVPSIHLLHQYDAIGFNAGTFGEDTMRYAHMIGARQPAWTVFAPNPRRTDRYHVFAAQTVDGQLLDVYNDRPFTFDRPYRQLNKQYPSYRDRFYMTSVRNAGFRGGASTALAEYICRTWREERGIEIAYIEMWVIAERVTLETIDNPEARGSSRSLFYRHGCDGREPVELELPGVEPSPGPGPTLPEPTTEPE